MNETVLKVTNLTKNYKNYRAVDDISFSVEKGQIVGFLGPNGAGKTTTIQILIGITNPSGGSIEYFGNNFSTHKEISLSRINFTSAFNTLLGRVSVWENLVVYANLYSVKDPKKKILELSEYFELGDLFNHVYWNLSAGQKTRVNLVKALLNQPELILMDEPTASLDPDVADKTLSLIEKLRKERELSILYTSHNMDEITRICDQVIFLDKGKIVAKDTPLNLTKRIKEATLILFISGNLTDVKDYLNKQNLKYSSDDHNHLSINTEESNIAQLILKIGSFDVSISDIEIKKPDLEDVFLEIARK